MPEKDFDRQPPVFHSYDEAVAYLDGLGLFHVELGLDRMKRALASLGVDRPFCPTVQVVGTNGKGSTSTFLQSLAMAHGLKTGLYTSPHFVRPEERIRIGQSTLPREEWPVYASRAVAACPGLTYFELLTVMAADFFRSRKCDLVVCEAGLGGRWDGTTALPADMVCFTPMGLDHTDVLGGTLAEIADDKSDALRPGILAAVSAPQPEAARAVLEAKAGKRDVPLFSLPQEAGGPCTPAGRELWNSLPEELKACAVLPKDAELGLYGAHQRVNAQTALLAWVLLCRRFGWKTDKTAIAEGLRQAFIPGRLQFVPAGNGLPALWLDGAHNTHGMTALKEAVDAMPAVLKPGAVVFSCLADKDPERLSALLRRTAGNVPVFVPTIPDNHRAASGETLASFVGGNAAAAEGIPQALAAAAKAAGRRPVLVCGSLYLLSALFSLYPALMEGKSDENFPYSPPSREAIRTMPLSFP